MTALVNDLNAKLTANGKEDLRVGFLTKAPKPERDPSRNIDGQLMPNAEAELAVLKIEADPPTDDVRYQPLGFAVGLVSHPSETAAAIVLSAKGRTSLAKRRGATLPIVSPSSLAERWKNSRG